jgi:hypothetical protein
MSHHITYERLERLLSDLGFVKRRLPERGLVFDHATSDTLLFLPDGRPGDLVRPAHLMAARRTLEERGLLTADAFENMLAQPAA